ncbi:MAG: pentapeptide repeat-containing protein [Proteobacteria bacterium]|nr:pentapeptide repeat-containing protein [Pseudomonadota bacterium]
MGAVRCGCILIGADLRESDLFSADFRGADLTSALVED